MVLSSKPPAANTATGPAQVQREQAPLEPAPVHEVYSVSKRLRAQVFERDDGLYSLEFERLMPGNPEHDEPSYWSPLNRPKTIVDTIDRARAMALEGLAEEAAAGTGRC